MTATQFAVPGRAAVLPFAGQRAPELPHHKRNFSISSLKKIVLLSIALMVSCVVFTVSTSPMTHIHIYRGIRSSFRFDSASSELTVEQMNANLDRTYLEKKFDPDTLLDDFQRAKMHREFALSFSHFAQQTTTPRGIVLPLFDNIAHLGMSLVLELRSLGVDLPLEIPHCGDLSAKTIQMIQSRDTQVRVYDVCAQALDATNVFGSGRRLFCGSMDQCQYHFQGFTIKILSVVFSQFEEVMLLDADTLFFQSPMQLWDTQRYNRTGTLFFHDRISSPENYLSERIANTKEGRQVSHLHMYLSKFDVSPYETLAAIPRAKSPATAKENMDVHLHFQPSEFLLSSHSWNLRAGHEMDSSLVLWNKAKQQRATAILASFVALNGIPMPPSYGDKELFFLACELAETEYAFSEFSVGSLGSDLQADGDKPKSVLCGCALHYLPSQGDVTRQSNDKDVQLLYLNSDDVLSLSSSRSPMYRTVARAADFYPGAFTDRGIPAECPFDIQALPLTTIEQERLTQRQRLHQQVQR
ncbi:hypothetical protein FI667_g7099, partial [Globisporangium splendens]